MIKQPLHILQVSRMDNRGGAERVAWNLQQAYQARGHSAWLAVGHKIGQHPDVFTIANDRSGALWSRFWWRVQTHLQPWLERTPQLLFGDRLARVLAHPAKLVNAYRGVEDFDFPGSWSLLNLTPQKPDIVHCHNLHHNYFDLRALPWLSQQAPVVLTLHDAWLLSGHCAHSFDCLRWQTGCGDCPDLTIYPPIRRDATAYNWQRKQEIYRKSQLYVATPCHWLMQKVKQSILAPAAVETRIIPYGIDLSVFCPADRQTVRAKLGLPQEARMLLFTANGIRQNIWKDYQMMRSVIALIAEQLPEEQIIFVALGEDGPVERIGQAEVHFVPYQKDPGVVAGYYQAADIYLHAARVDTFPNTVLEALACGAPVIATAVGGIPEQIKSLNCLTGKLLQSLNLSSYGVDQATGVLIAPGDVQGMAAGVTALLNDPILWSRLSENAVQDAKSRFDLHRQATDYLCWYEEIIERCPLRQPVSITKEVAKK